MVFVVSCSNKGSGEDQQRAGGARRARATGPRPSAASKKGAKLFSYAGNSPWLLHPCGYHRKNAPGGKQAPPIKEARFSCRYGRCLNEGMETPVEVISIPESDRFANRFEARFSRNSENSSKSARECLSRRKFFQKNRRIGPRCGGRTENARTSKKTGISRLFRPPQSCQC